MVDKVDHPQDAINAADGGEAGARRAIVIYREEIDRVLALPGCTSVAALSTSGMQYLHILPGTLRGALQGVSNPRPALRVIGSAQPAAGG